MRPMFSDVLSLPIALTGIFAALGFGIWLGRYLAARPFRHLIRDYSASETLGAMLQKGEQEKAALAFKDSATAAAEMTQYSYAVPNVMTPFVGCGPLPGQSGNAFINPMQFRSTRDIVLPKPAGTYRIFLIGGSTAFGSGAPSQDSIIGACLERELNKALTSPAYPRTIEVWTLANPSWTSTHERILIENRLCEMEPDMVMSLSGSNDVHWAGGGRNISWFRTYADQHFWELLNQGRRLAGYPPMPEVTESPRPVPPSRVGERLERNVRLSATALGFIGSQYIFVLQPGVAVTSKPLSERERELRNALPPSALENFESSYAEILRRLAGVGFQNFHYLDLSDVFSPLSKSDEIFLDSYHFGDRGNEILALAIADEIKKRVRPALG
jgi:lysophospholipase L1-like esterase